MAPAFEQLAVETAPEECQVMPVAARVLHSHAITGRGRIVASCAVEVSLFDAKFVFAINNVLVLLHDERGLIAALPSFLTGDDGNVAPLLVLPREIDAVVKSAAVAEARRCGHYLPRHRATGVARHEGSKLINDESIRL